MGEILERAVAALKALPKEERERFAWEILERLEDKNEWDRIVSSEAAQKWLKEAAEAALRAYSKVSTHMTGTLLSLPPAMNRLRSDAYWRYFEELPPEVRVQAEKNYALWKENPKHPSLRFKQIHPDMPIFSYRVGLRYRTVGVQAPDGRVVWFWIGPFEAFQDIVRKPVPPMPF